MSDLGREPVVDFARLGRRLGLSAAVLGGLAVTSWAVSGLWLGFGPTRLFGFIGVALGMMFVVEVVVVGGSAVTGLLRAGESGERLARGDVGMLPPQVSRRLRRRQ